MKPRPAVLSRRAAVNLLLPALLLALFSHTARAWVYPEHREITLIALQRLDAERTAVLDRLWADARRGYESRLSRSPADPGAGIDPTTIDLAAWPALAGDHSCSSARLLATVLESDWVLNVAGVAARLKRELAAAQNRSERVNALRDSDLRLQRADPEYATRAGSNNVHFLLAKPRPDMGTAEYITGCVHEGTELNALGTYIALHQSALQKADRLRNPSLSDSERPALVRAMLADEMFALHFLQDVFSSGHVAGTWGDASLRKGTHDYYSERGLATVTWDGTPIIIAGDAWMRGEDAELAELTIRESITQVLDQAAGRGPALQFAAGAPATPDTFDVCSNTLHPRSTFETTLGSQFGATLLKTPVPALTSGMGELPRFRAELGPFIGIVPELSGGTLGGSFSPLQRQVGGVGGMGTAVRLGFGMEGILNESGDGLIFLDLGVRLDGSSTTSILDLPQLRQFGAAAAAIPSRDAYTVRLRMPFYLIPGDLLLAAPILGLASPSTFTQVAVTAGSGGLIPWQAGMATFLGRFQFVAGREVSVAFFGYDKSSDRMIIPLDDNGTRTGVIAGVRSMEFDFPMVEYRAFRTFSTDQSSSLLAQLTAGFDVPTRIEVIEPTGAPEPDLKTTWHVKLRVAFDWRYYLGSGTGAHR